MTDAPDLSAIDTMLRNSGDPDWERLAFLASCREAYTERVAATVRTCPDCGRIVTERQTVCRCGRVLK